MFFHLPKYISPLCHSSGTFGAAFWCCLASFWMFTVKTKIKWSFPPLRTSGTGCWRERKFGFSHKMYRSNKPAEAACSSLQMLAHPSQGDILKHVPELQVSSPPQFSQGCVYRVWPPVSFTDRGNDWSVLGDWVCVSSLSTGVDSEMTDCRGINGQWAFVKQQKHISHGGHWELLDCNENPVP